MTNDLTGRVALVTGGGRGIGRAISETLSLAGAAVVIADNGVGINGDAEDPGIAKKCADALDGADAIKGDVAAFTDSIASPGAAQAAVDFAVEQFGAIDIVVNNAAILRDGFVFKATPEDFEAVLRNNLFAPFYVTQAASAVMRNSAKIGRGGDTYRWGRIINIISTAGLYGNLGQTAYASAKAGLVGMTRVAAMDLARAGIAVNAVAPFAATRVTETIIAANEAQEAYKRRALTLTADHVGQFVGFLAADAAADISGQIFAVRGREIFLFNQSRPVARFVRQSSDHGDIAASVKAHFTDHFTDLTTDLEAFNTEPVL